LGKLGKWEKGYIERDRVEKGAGAGAGGSREEMIDDR
jgi:hypothetical protein